MPRSKSGVKNKGTRPLLVTPGLVDLHFHGAFGIDLMSAEKHELDELALRLERGGVAAFCPTTLSSSRRELLAAVKRLGSWTSAASASARRAGSRPGARPLGLHLEGPFISPASAGAHPPGAVRALDFQELGELWEASLGTLKILTIAPERLDRRSLARLAGWARARKIVLSLGHSRASEREARAAFDAGFSSVTHAWNALAFHHREPGVLGAALGRPDVSLELIPDGIHVDPTVIRWTRKLHPPGRVCFVSDCIPSAATRSGWHAFGDLRVRRSPDGGSRLRDGRLAGGGRLITESYSRWLEAEARETGQPPLRLLRETIGHLTSAPLRALGLHSGALGKLRLEWLQPSRGFGLTPRPRCG